MLLQPVGDALSVAEARRDVDELRRERELPAGVRRAVVAEDVAVQAVGEGLVVVEATGDLQRLGAHRPPAPPGGVGVAQRAAREPDEPPHARRAVVGRQRRERPLEQHREQRIVARDVPDDPAAVAQGGLREVVGEIVGRGELGGLPERALGRDRVARASADLADREQELAPRRCPAGQAPVPARRGGRPPRARAVPPPGRRRGATSGSRPPSRPRASVSDGRARSDGPRRRPRAPGRRGRAARAGASR